MIRKVSPPRGATGRGRPTDASPPRPATGRARQLDTSRGAGGAAPPKERPILFSGQMVKAILAGAKTQTRRVINPQPAAGVQREQVVVGRASPTGLHDGHGRALRCPYGLPGDRLWVRETFAMRVDIDHAAEPDKARHYAMYRADGAGDPHDLNNWHNYGQRWRPAIHMPRALSRLLLDVVELRCQRLHEITDADAKAEGAAWRIAPGGDLAGAFEGIAGDIGYRNHFRDLWQSINGERAPWDDNPWVWAVTFALASEVTRG